MKQKGFTPPRFLPGGKSTIDKHEHGRPSSGKNHSKKTGAGFTLIELLVVIAIIGLLASIITVSINNARRKSRDAKRVSDLHQIATALNMYIQDNPVGVYPIGSFDTRPWYTPPSDWNTFKAYLVPKYVSQLPIPPMNGQQDGAMCSNCDEYHYFSSADGKRYAVCTYLAASAPTNTQDIMGYNVYGPWYCITDGCSITTLLEDWVCI